MYRHALPPGFVLKSQKKKTEDDALRNQISLEEFLEVCVSLLLLLCPRLLREKKREYEKLTGWCWPDPDRRKTASDTSWTSPS